MPLTLHPEPRDVYLQVTCQGTYNLASLVKAFEEALHLTADRNLRGLLLDVRPITGEPPSTADRYELGRQVAVMQRKYSPAIQIAVVGHEPFIDPQRLGETVALNRGAAGKVFTDFDQAVAWLIAAAKAAAGKGKGER